jgi:hypothetical protein
MQVVSRSIKAAITQSLSVIFRADAIGSVIIAAFSAVAPLVPFEDETPTNVLNGIFGQPKVTDNH